jgi:zinc transport system substrate-binding protein
VPRALLLVPVVLAGLLSASACGGTAGSGARPTVVAGFYPLAWVAEQVSHGAVDVRNLTPPGREPHDLELTPREVGDVKSADVVLYLGHGFQPALEDAARGQEGAVDLLAGQRLRAADGGRAEVVDPHVWLDPTRLAAIAETVARALRRPRAARPLVARLEALDSEYRSGLADCARREIVTSHAAFGYLADAYGLRQLALTGISPEAEPSPRALERLVREVEQTGATTVFFESLVSPRLAETVAREAGVRAAKLDPLEGLTRDEVAAGDDYVSVMRRNLAALRRALGCR